MADTIILYHYTTKKGKNGIRQAGVINESRKKSGTIDDARYGDGVYLTSLPPTNGKIQLALNNWDGDEKRVKRYVNWGKVDCYVKVILNKKEAKKIDEEDGRDIYMCPGDLTLAEAIEFSFGDVAKK